MERLLSSRTAKRVPSLVLLCCFWVFAVPTDARAQAPAFGDTKCFVQSVTMGGVTTWQIKGTTSVKNLPAGSMGAVNFQFQKLPNGAGNWANMFSVNQSFNGSGTVMLDTGFQNFTPAPGKGDQYRVVVSGAWGTKGPPPQSGNLVPVVSLPVTPIP